MTVECTGPERECLIAQRKDNSHYCRGKICLLQEEAEMTTPESRWHELISKLKHIITAIETVSAEGHYPRMMMSEHGGEGVMPLYDTIHALETSADTSSESERKNDTFRLEWLFSKLDDTAIVKKIDRVGKAYTMGARSGVKLGDFRGAIDQAIYEEQLEKDALSPERPSTDKRPVSERHDYDNRPDDPRDC